MSGVDIEAQSRLSALLARVEATGEPVVICRDGKPVAELRRIAVVEDPWVPHPLLSQVVFHEDPMAPLDPEDWPESEPR